MKKLISIILGVIFLFSLACFTACQNVDNSDNPSNIEEPDNPNDSDSSDEDDGNEEENNYATSSQVTVIDSETNKEIVNNKIMYLQKAILAKIAKIKNLPYRLSCSEEESIGIDGYVGKVAYSIKPDTYKTMNRLSEEISVKMIYYKKTKTGLTLEIDD